MIINRNAKIIEKLTSRSISLTSKHFAQHIIFVFWRYCSIYSSCQLKIWQKIDYTKNRCQKKHYRLIEHATAQYNFDQSCHLCDWILTLFSTSWNFDIYKRWLRTLTSKRIVFDNTQCYRLFINKIDVKWTSRTYRENQHWRNLYNHSFTRMQLKHNNK